MNYTCECGKEFTFAETLAGRRARCKQCGRVFRIPAAEDVVDLTSGSSVVLESAVFEELRTMEDACAFAADQAEAAVRKAQTLAEQTPDLDGSVREAVETARRELERTRKELEDARRALRQTEVTLTYWQDKIRNADKDREGIVSERDRALAELEGMKSRLREAEYALSRADDTKQKELEELKADTVHLADMYETQEGRFRAVEAERDQLQQGLLKAMEDAAEARRETQEARESLSRQLRTVQSLEQDFRRQLDEERQRGQADAQRVEAEKSVMSSALRDTRDKVKKLLAQMQEAEHESCAREAQLKVTGDRLKAELAQVRDEKTRLENSRGTLGQELERERKRLEETQETLRHRERAYEAQQAAQLAETEAVRAELEKARGQLVQKDAQHLSVRDQFSKELADVRQAREKEASRAIELQSEVQLLRSKKDRAIEELQKSLKDNKRLREELEMLREEFRRNQDAKSQMATVLNTALEQARHARLELDEAEQEIQTIRQERQRQQRTERPTPDEAWENALGRALEESAERGHPRAANRPADMPVEAVAAETVSVPVKKRAPRIETKENDGEEEDRAGRAAGSSRLPNWRNRKSALPIIGAVILGCLLWGLLSNVDIRFGARPVADAEPEQAQAEPKLEKRPGGVVDSLMALGAGKMPELEKAAPEDIAACKAVELPKNEVSIAKAENKPQPARIAIAAPQAKEQARDDAQEPKTTVPAQPVARICVALPPLPHTGK